MEKLIDSAVLVLNYGRGHETLHCLKSLQGLEPKPRWMVVVDNASEDDSWDLLRAWGERLAPSVAVRRAWPDCHAWGAEDCIEWHLGNGQFAVLLRNAVNRGFAGGNNVGLRYLLDQPDARYVWLLNNDTVVEPDALVHLHGALQTLPGSGIACSTVRYERDPVIVQAYGGGRYYPVLGSTTLNGNGTRFDRNDADARVSERRDFPLGASMLVTRQFLKDVGLLDERFFLYFEELDWMLRAKGRFTLAYAPLSMVWHKEGSSIGASQAAVHGKSLLGDYHFQRSRLLLSRKHFPSCFPFVLLSLVVTLMKRIYRRQWARVPMLWRCVLEVCRVPL